MSEIDPKLLEVLICPQTRSPLRYDKARQQLISDTARIADEARELEPDE